MNEREALLQFCDNLSKAINQLRMNLDDKTAVVNVSIPLVKPLSTIDQKLAGIHWEKRKNKVGEEFEIAEAKKNVDNSDYDELANTLVEKGRIHEGLWYWLFQNGDAVGRKIPKEKPKK